MHVHRFVLSGELSLCLTSVRCIPVDFQPVVWFKRGLLFYMLPESGYLLPRQIFSSPGICLVLNVTFDYNDRTTNRGIRHTRVGMFVYDHYNHRVVIMQ